MEKPTIEVPEGPAPADLVLEDLVVGDGAEAVEGGYVKVHYLGVTYDTGDEFDSTWDRGEAAEFRSSGLSKAGRRGFLVCESVVAGNLPFRLKRPTGQQAVGIRWRGVPLFS